MGERGPSRKAGLPSYRAAGDGRPPRRPPIRPGRPSASELPQSLGAQQGYSRGGVSQRFASLPANFSGAIKVDTDSGHKHLVAPSVEHPTAAAGTNLVLSPRTTGGVKAG